MKTNFSNRISLTRHFTTLPPELIQGPGVLPNRGDKSIYKRDKKKWAVEVG